jgi:nicotinate-nucleotide pyrophosphorylase (carboxylating)
MVVSGLLAAQAVFKLIDPSVCFEAVVEDSDTLSKHSPIAKVSGNLNSILKAERLALNVLQHLSGVATLTYQFAATISRTQAKIAHTRKTMPGLRYLETQAVLHGGGVLHRQSLSETVMLKDNHIQALGGITLAVNKIRAHHSDAIEIQVECETLEQVQEALSLKVSRIMLDNMAPSVMKQAVEIINHQAIVEASGGVSLSNIIEIAKTGVDIISTSQLTLSAPAADIHLEFQK